MTSHPRLLRGDDTSDRRHDRIIPDCSGILTPFNDICDRLSRQVRHDDTNKANQNEVSSPRHLSYKANPSGGVYRQTD